PLPPCPRVGSAQVATFVVVRPAEGHREKRARVLPQPRHVDPLEEEAHAWVPKDLGVEAVERGIDRRLATDLFVERHPVLLVQPGLAVFTMGEDRVIRRVTATRSGCRSPDRGGWPRRERAY